MAKAQELNLQSSSAPFLAVLGLLPFISATSEFTVTNDMQLTTHMSQAVGCWSLLFH